MAFQVDDIVKKTGGSQKYKVSEVLPESKYECVYEPLINPNIKFTFKEADLELA